MNLNGITWSIAQPLDTHFRPATCKESNCRHWREGWRTVIDEATTMGQQQAHYIRRESGRQYREAKNEMGLTVFTFEAGQRCFGRHRIAIERDAVFKKNGLGMFGWDWFDDFKENSHKLQTQISKG